MSPALLDVTVLLALFDATHTAHAAASRWLTGMNDDWATCAITENGFARIRANPSYPAPVTVAESLGDLRKAREHGGHQFWPCDLSATDATAIDPTRLLTPSAITDVYLLALAVRHGGRFVTFDRRITIEAVIGARPDHLVVLS
ncbi:MAG: PIN domain-containing protein [Bifidobacteriaceae bacterium]|jgi:toxin-antitoxin system PIN domain toxin|nr:PIN domain-containing protein [Bifidobacteriaceae bacterium]